MLVFCEEKDSRTWFVLRTYLESQQVVPIQSGARSGSFEFQTSTGGVEVVFAQRWAKLLVAFERSLVGAA